MGHDRKSKRYNYGGTFFTGGTRRNNYVCFQCRLTSREGERCPNCQQKLKYAGYKWRVPSKNDDKGWKAYREHVREIRAYRDRNGEGELAWWQISQARSLLTKWKR